MSYSGSGIVRLQFGRGNQPKCPWSREVTWQECNRWPRHLEQLRRGLHEYLCGQPVNPAQWEWELDAADWSPFRIQVTRALRRIKRGQVVTYGELATKCGSPDASRAVGHVMATNPVPLLVPCHRVVGRHGVGGFSAPGGVAIKLWLLELEGADPYAGGKS